MGGKAVAGKGDVEATVGTKPFTGADSGKWTAGSVEVTASTTLKAGGAFVLHAASCTFSFDGKNAAGPVKGTSAVALEAKASLLQPGGRPVLLHGDSAEDGFGNTLEVTSARPLRSS
ncbi:hypothetical protein [Streptomyces sp. NPDC007369]|uniref:hypothetical protein n=1 Tax=Streptomyces sp. NPDC007369 TaxID=3154589 RepID=UPI0033D386C1